MTALRKFIEVDNRKALVGLCRIAGSAPCGLKRVGGPAFNMVASKMQRLSKDQTSSS